MSSIKAQSAMEYLMTYGWAILILSIAIAALWAMGVFNPPAPTLCAFPADFGCVGATLYTNGILVVNLQQATASTVNVTAIGCNQYGTTTNMTPFTPTSAQISLPIGGNATFSMNCYTNGARISNLQLNNIYSGFVVANYIDIQSGFLHQVVGRVVQQVV